MIISTTTPVATRLLKVLTWGLLLSRLEAQVRWMNGIYQRYPFHSSLSSLLHSRDNNLGSLWPRTIDRSRTAKPRRMEKKKNLQCTASEPEQSGGSITGSILIAHLRQVTVDQILQYCNHSTGCWSVLHRRIEHLGQSFASPLANLMTTDMLNLKGLFKLINGVPARHTARGDTIIRRKQPTKSFSFFFFFFFLFFIYPSLPLFPWINVLDMTWRIMEFRATKWNVIQAEESRWGFSRQPRSWRLISSHIIILNKLIRPSLPSPRGTKLVTSCQAIPPLEAGGIGIYLWYYELSLVSMYILLVEGSRTPAG